ncbi:hypothetical protein DXG01_009986 [Tephrocybe rancida]|nr:hypothetical protein DXG01_009986 [Tephrocybe rancida]
MSDEAPAPEIQINVKGRVLKDDDPLTTYKIQSGHTIHMVKGAAPASSGASSGAAPAAAPRQVLPTMQTGQLASDPLTQLNGHRGFGAMAGVNPFADMGLNPNDPNMMQGMLNNPAFMQQMSAMMSNPDVIEQIIQNSPQLAGDPEHARRMLTSPIMRGIMSDPQQLQQLLQMSASMQPGGAGANPFGGMGGFPAPGAPGGGFPAPGTPGATTGATPNANATPAVAAPNPFMWPGTGAGLGGAGAGAGANPWAMDPAMMQQFFGGAGGFGGAGAGVPATPAAPADTRPAEERFQVQLGQLNEMGFVNATQNIRALLATGGNVHGAIEYMLGGGGL